jgi:hypothetical protein
VVHDARPQAQPPPAPITAGQVSDLLSEKAVPDPDPNLFVTVEPEECAGAVREVDPPFLFGADTPAAHDGGQYFADDVPFSVSVVEMVAVYPADFSPSAAVERAKREIDACRDETMRTTTMDGGSLNFRMLPQGDPGTADIALWSFRSGNGWFCDNAFVAAHNAAVELTTCGDVGGYDVRALADAALERIRALANVTA